jgi:hypothetical protein
MWRRGKLEEAHALRRGTRVAGWQDSRLSAPAQAAVGDSRRVGGRHDGRREEQDGAHARGTVRGCRGGGGAAHPAAPEVSFAEGKGVPTLTPMSQMKALGEGAFRRRVHKANEEEERAKGRQLQAAVEYIIDQAPGQPRLCHASLSEFKKGDVTSQSAMKKAVKRAENGKHAGGRRPLALALVDARNGADAAGTAIVVADAELAEGWRTASEVDDNAVDIDAGSDNGDNDNDGMCGGWNEGDGEGVALYHMLEQANEEMSAGDPDSNLGTQSHAARRKRRRERWQRRQRR